jgi:anti-anti-sigma factor
VTLADVQFSTQGDVTVARTIGEIDLSNAENITGAITDAIPNASLTLVLDLTDVDYLDSAGIRLVYQLREHLHARGQTLRLVVPSNSPANDALRLAGVLRHIETNETVGEALHKIG